MQARPGAAVVEITRGTAAARAHAARGHEAAGEA